MMGNDQISQFLTVILILLIAILFILLTVFIILTVKRKNESKPAKSTQNNQKTEVKKKDSGYNRQSIFEFMEFDKVEDNMIVRKNGNKYIMAIECQGVNYDLMSGLEKNSVEQGFLQFLNTLRYPIQLYIQTRTVNLESSINTYKQRVNEIKNDYMKKQMEYNSVASSGSQPQKIVENARFEMVKAQNLYEYGMDIIQNTERMNFNKNILKKHYYVIISYTPEDINKTDYAMDEVKNMAFSELYTKAQAIINSLAVCGINSKILDSTELAELLYVAYNRDESETFNLRKALNAGYEDLYSTAPDVLDKRMKELDLKIEQDAIKKANEAIYDVVEENEKQRRAKRKEEELNKLIDQMAKALIEENKRSIGQDVAEEAIEKIDKDSKKKETKEEKGGDKDGEKTKTTRRKSTRTV